VIARMVHDAFNMLQRYVPVLEYCGGTEIGGGYVCGSMSQPQCPSWFSTSGFGLTLSLLNESGQIIENDGDGEVALVGPSLGLSTTLLNGRDHYKEYYEGMPDGLRRHGDRLRRVGQFYRAMGRSDDAMKLGGIKVSFVRTNMIRFNKSNNVRNQDQFVILRISAKEIFIHCTD
jgi:acetyl-CoA synthetase